MPRFCTKCGTKNADDAKFCENCGAPLQRADAPHTAPQVPVPPVAPAAAPSPAAVPGPRPARSPMVWLVAVLAVVLVLTAGLAWWVFERSTGPTQAQVSAAANLWLRRNQPQLLRDACLRNFNYAADPVFVNSFDQGTRQWLDALVKAGIYTPPQKVQSGFMTQFKYSHGPQAASHIRDGALCAASGLAIDSVRVLPPDSPQMRNGLPDAVKLPRDWAFAEVTLHWTGLAPWTRQEPFSAQFTRLSSNLQQVIMLRKSDQGWVLPSEAEVLAQQAQLAALSAGAQVNQAARQLGNALGGAAQVSGGGQDAVPQATAQAGGFFHWLRNLFGFGDPATRLPPEFFSAVMEGRTQDAYALLGPNMQILGPDKMRMAMQSMQQQFQSKGGLKDVKTDQVSDVPEGKRVTYVLHFGDGTQESGAMIVGKMGDQWRILDIKG